ncbi:MAG: hypothetical protein DWQ02_07430 [Bacteroidetes bacterium]|nr:MAG: hypothetical protein DWQ02_07430 [Bacteroidota bacterium]
MRINTVVKILCLIGLGITFSFCTDKNIEDSPGPAEIPVKINLDHFHHLYHEIQVDEDTLGIVHIYSEYPDYEYAIEPREGYTCVDDVARSIVMLSEYLDKFPEENGSPEIKGMIQKMVSFLLHMQNENGYFNNFMWNDYRINTTYRTTVAELNWWSIRALWALETAYPLLGNDPGIQEQIEKSTEILVENFKRDLLDLPVGYDTMNTIIIPTWLPNQYAADQSGVLILGLLPYYHRTADGNSLQLIRKLADGIMEMQKGDSLNFPYNAFLSWGNIWHAWGNSQAYALLKAGNELGDSVLITSGLKEVDHFYPYLLENGHRSAFWIEMEGDGFAESKREEFARIAYGIRPMAWAAMEAYAITGELKYKKRAVDLASWFLGNNITGIKMYDEGSGRGYDGIISPDEINRNAGAESTIECLLTLLRTYH